jgi:hypothetical protein
MLARRLRLPRQKANDGKVLLSVHRSDASLKARIEELEAQLTNAETSAASHRADFERELEPSGNFASFCRATAQGSREHRTD